RSRVNEVCKPPRARTGPRWREPPPLLPSDATDAVPVPHAMRTARAGAGCAAPGSARGGVRLLARGQEPHRRRAFLGQLQVDPGGREVDQFAGGVDGQVHRVLVAEFLELALVLALDPACGRHL